MGAGMADPDVGFEIAAVVAEWRRVHGDDCDEFEVLSHDGRYQIRPVTSL